MILDDVWDDLMQTKLAFRPAFLSTNENKEHDTISWNKYSPGIYKSLYAKEYEIIVRDKQYTFLLKESRGCIQIFYIFKDNSLDKMKLCYYPYPVGLRESSDEIEGLLADYNDEIIGEYYYDLYSLFSHEFTLSTDDASIKRLVEESRNAGNFDSEERLILGRFEDKYKFTNTSHIRIDYDANVKSHHKCEIQMGGINNIRIPLNKIIMPFTFCDFIVRYAFPEKYKEIVAKATYNSTFINSRKKSVTINPFVENNIFINHL